MIQTCDKTIFLLKEKAFISVTGLEAQVFLQRIFTNNIDALNLNSFQLNALCNKKGQVLFLCKTLKIAENNFLLCLHQSSSARALKLLSMYKLRTQVHLEESKHFAAIGTYNTETISDWLKNGFFQHSPQENFEFSRSKLGYLLKYTTEQQTFYEWILTDRLPAALNPDTNTQMWKLMHLKNAWVEFTDSMAETFIPQKIGLDKRNGISFKKGCFPGQEIAARTHYLGQKYYLYYAYSSSKEALEQAINKPIFIINALQQEEVYHCLFSSKEHLKLSYTRLFE